MITKREGYFNITFFNGTMTHTALDVMEDPAPWNENENHDSNNWTLTPSEVNPSPVDPLEDPTLLNGEKAFSQWE